MPFSLDVDRYLELLQPDRCLLCFLTNSGTHEHLKSLFEESVTDPKSRKSLSGSKGFCRRHAWLAVNLGQSLGLSIIYADLIQKELERLSQKPGLFAKSPNKSCPICESEKRIDHTHVQHFVSAWAQSDQLREAFSRKGVLCLNHLEKTLQEKASPSHRKSLLESVKKALEPVLKDLNEFLDKQDYHRSKEAFGKERDAWIRAVRLVSGER